MIGAAGIEDTPDCRLTREKIRQRHRIRSTARDA
jgi:hypothetical protein